MSESNRSWGLLAEYETAAAIFRAAERVRDAGYRKWDTYTPFPVHNLDKAMGLRPSPIPWIVFTFGMIGLSAGFSLQTWVSAIEYPIIVQGKPYLSYQAWVPVCFEMGVLLASFGAIMGMFGLNKLPQYYHALFNSARFRRVTDDRFFLAIEVRDPKYDPDRTRKLLEETGAVAVEEVEA
jgi:hypothetical protein